MWGKAQADLPFKQDWIYIFRINGNSSQLLLFLLLISDQGLTIYDFRSIVDLMASVFFTRFLHKSKIVNLYS